MLQGGCDDLRSLHDRNLLQDQDGAGFRYAGRVAKGSSPANRFIDTLEPRLPVAGLVAE
ncbi:hypothetical protein GCM10009838_84230 [Catenulispora subtropica]|uniref:Uncharacterized protein n=1 Tax=Catenulispora subtropica TaxID=450798 RepID=A0ABP5EUD3_9ACTN